MDWLEIRAHLERAFEAADRTQAQVAAQGGLKGQNAVSKILANKKMGPTVQNFTKVVEGLGLSISEFFRRLEHPATGDQEIGRDIVLQGSYAKRTALQAKPGVGKSFVIDTLIEALQRAQTDASPHRRAPTRRRKRRPRPRPRRG